MADRILFVDDEGVVLKSLTRALSTRYDITTAYSAEEAVELMELYKFSVVITDMRMPGGDGLWLINQASGAHSSTKFIVLTGNCDAQTKEAALNTGRVDAFLSKPCSIDALDEAIESALESRVSTVNGA